MNGANEVGVALVGFGTVGTGVARILLENGSLITHKTGLRLRLAHVVDKDTTRPRPLTLPEGLLHGDLQRALDDPAVGIVVELVGGTTIAADIQKKALVADKDVVTANKALLAERGEEIYQTARTHGRSIAFEASCCGGIPIIGALRTGLAANNISAIYGVVNGTCNYILTEMNERGKTYATALREAQAAGLAEADPTLDVDGSDSAHKLAILASLVLGQTICYDDIPITGIDQVDVLDIQYGKEMGYIMKLLAIAEQTEKGLWLQVAPAFIDDDEPLAEVDGAFNAVSVFGDAVGHTSYYGRGAGMMPTASAVVADIIETARGNSGKLFAAAPAFGRAAPQAKLCPPKDIHSRFYIRLNVVDQMGVFAKIGQVLGDCRISISALMQHESHSRNDIPVVVMTHRACQADMDEAIDRLEALDVVNTRPVCIHVITPPMDEQE